MGRLDVLNLHFSGIILYADLSLKKRPSIPNFIWELVYCYRSMVDLGQIRAWSTKLRLSAVTSSSSFSTTLPGTLQINPGYRLPLPKYTGDDKRTFEDLPWMSHR